MELNNLVFVYVFLFLAGVSAVALYSELRRRKFRQPAGEDRVFKCEKCAFVYTDDHDVDRSRCSQCGTLNDAINF
ncbi:MAG: hypothetical protein JWN25_1917 [Verrucomicrobiales bacterium]|jgi:predicted Zn-ribbon and HTH transcriptional regulator|nr:hypothetical protein [Verrucomicrobiales bacterium]MDB6130332.1 hypothetical protein [Verrucomicrobiales bacterium]